jgi:hypothetical protein
VVAFITSNVSTAEPWDLPLVPNSKNGLKLPSTVKTSKIATLHTGLVAGKLGHAKCQRARKSGHEIEVRTTDRVAFVLLQRTL